MDPEPKSIYAKDYGSEEKKPIEYSEDIFFTKINSKTDKVYRSVLIDTEYRERKISHVMKFILQQHTSNPNYRVLYIVARKVLVLERYGSLNKTVPAAVSAHEGGTLNQQMLVCYIGELEKLSDDAQYDLVVCEEVGGIMARLVLLGAKGTPESIKKRQETFNRVVDAASKRVFLNYGENKDVKKFVSDICLSDPPDMLYYAEGRRTAARKANLVDEGIMFAKIKNFIKKGKRCIVCCGTREDAERIYRIYNSGSFRVLLLTSRTADEHRDTVMQLKEKIGEYKMVVYTTTRAVNPDVCGSWADAVFSYTRAAPKSPTLMVQVMMALNIDYYFCKAN